MTRNLDVVKDAAIKMTRRNIANNVVILRCTTIRIFLLLDFKQDQMLAVAQIIAKELNYEDSDEAASPSRSLTFPTHCLSNIEG